jgi:hypothetical protein
MPETGKLSFEYSFTCNNPRQRLIRTNELIGVLPPLKFDCGFRVRPFNQTGLQ